MLFSKKKLLLCLFLTLSFSAFSMPFSQNKTSEQDIPISYIYASWTININNLNWLVGSCENVFVGYINDLTKTDYSYHFCPVTMYNVTVVSNIKGDAPLGETVTVGKEGGLLQDGKCYVLYRDDKLPKAGQFYFFCTSPRDNYDYFADGPTSTQHIPVSTSNKTFSIPKHKSSEESSTSLTSVFTS